MLWWPRVKRFLDWDGRNLLSNIVYCKFVLQMGKLTRLSPRQYFVHGIFNLSNGFNRTIPIGIYFYLWRRLYILYIAFQTITVIYATVSLSTINLVLQSELLKFLLHHTYHSIESLIMVKFKILCKLLNYYYLNIGDR